MKHINKLKCYFLIVMSFLKIIQIPKIKQNVQHLLLLQWFLSYSVMTLLYELALSVVVSKSSFRTKSFLCLKNALIVTNTILHNVMRENSSCTKSDGHCQNCTGLPPSFPHACPSLSSQYIAIGFLQTIYKQICPTPMQQIHNIAGRTEGIW
jgi:hypothetical protein